MKFPLCPKFAKRILSASSFLFFPIFFACVSLHAEITPKIIGGKTTENKWPWMAAIVKSNVSDNFNAQFCGGTLVHPYYVLTAAHCMFDPNSGALRSPDELQVIVGIYDLKNDTDLERTSIVEIIIHPHFNRITQNADIALLLLETPANTPTIPFATDESQEAPGTDVTIIGWGNTVQDPQSTAIFPNKLREVTVPIVDLETANAEISYNGALTENMLPAGFAEGGHDSCEGDSGGPVVVQNPDDESYTQVGIVSFAEGCAEPNFYGINTRVSSFHSWIRHHLMPQYAAWEVEKSISGPDKDPDNDGLPNIFEHATNSNPLDGAGGNEQAALQLVNVDSQIFPAITFNEVMNTQELKYTVEESFDFKNWTPLNHGELLVDFIDQGNNYAQTTIRSANPITGANSFLRLTVQATGQYVPAPRFLSIPNVTFARIFSLDQSDPNREEANYFIKDYQLELLPEDKHVFLQTDSTDFIPFMQIIDSTKKVLTSSNPSTDDNIVNLTFQPVPEETYIARISSTTPDATGHYELLISPFNETDEPIIAIGQTIESDLSIDDPFDPNFIDSENSENSKFYYKDDYFLANAPIGTQIEITLESSDFDAYLYVFAEPNTIIAENDDISTDPLDRNSRITFTVQANQIYFLRISTAGEKEVGDYTLTTQEIAPE